jgi:hypothetical protein
MMWSESYMYVVDMEKSNQGNDSRRRLDLAPTLTLRECDGKFESSKQCPKRGLRERTAISHQPYVVAVPSCKAFLPRMDEVRSRTWLGKNRCSAE